MKLAKKNNVKMTNEKMTSEKMINERVTAISFKHSIAVTLSKIGVLIAFIFGFLISVFQIYNDYVSQEDELTKTVMQILQVTESSAKQAVYEYDDVLANKVINGLFSYQPITKAIITDDFGEVLAQAKKNVEIQKPWWVIGEVLSGQRQFQINIITKDSLDNSQAQLIVQVDAYSGASAFYVRASIIFVSGIIRNILLAFALLALFHYLISKPLLVLISHLIAIDPEHPDRILTISSKHKNNELGLLTSSINVLLKSIVDHIKEVEGLNEHLEQRVDERAQALKIKSQEALESMALLKDTQLQLLEAEKDAALGGLVAGIAHEVNTPLGITVTAASSLQDMSIELSEKIQAGNISRAEFDRYLKHYNSCTELILKNSARASALITRFKKIAVDQESFEKRLFYFVEYVEDIIFTLQPKLKNTQIAVRIECTDDFEVINYPGAIAQIVSNLVLNALIHGFDKNVKGQIIISIEKQGEMIVMNVTDDGKGIEESDLSKVFEPFYTTKRNAGGSGLGLHIISNIVTNTLHGRVSCSSEVGVGSCFHLEFPASADENKTEQPIKSP